MKNTTYLNFESDDIKGPVWKGAHVNAIAVLSWSQAFTQAERPAQFNDTGVTHQAVHGEFTFKKKTDSATVMLLKHCWNGRLIPSATFSVYRQNESEADKLFLTIKMTNVVVASLAVDGGGDETITLAYEKISYSDYPGPVDGPQARPRTVHHDLKLCKIS